MKTSRYFGTLAMLVVAVPVLLALAFGSTTPPEAAAEARLTDVYVEVLPTEEVPQEQPSWLPEGFSEWCPNPGQDGGCGTVCGSEGEGRWGVCWMADIYEDGEFVSRPPSFPCFCGKIPEVAEAPAPTGLVEFPAPQAPYGWESGQEIWGAQTSIVTFAGGDAFLTRQGWQVFDGDVWVPVETWLGFWRDGGFNGSQKLGVFKVHSRPDGWQKQVSVGTEIHFCGPQKCYAGIVQSVLIIARKDEINALSVCSTDTALVTCRGTGANPSERTVYCLRTFLPALDGYLATPPNWGGW